MVPEICTKMLKKWSEKLRPKFAATTTGCSMVKVFMPRNYRSEIVSPRKCDVFKTNILIGTFRSEDEDEYQYEISVLSMRIRFKDRHFSKCACSEQKTRTRSRPRLPI